MKFDNLINSFLKEEEISRKDRLTTLKSIRESFEYDFNLDLGDDFFEGIPVKVILPEDSAGDDVFTLDASITMRFDIHSGEAQSWDSPGFDDEAEITDVRFDGATIYRYVQSTDEYVEVTPESIGEEVYAMLLSKLKAMAEELAVKDAYDNIDTQDYHEDA